MAGQALVGPCSCSPALPALTFLFISAHLCLSLLVPTTWSPQPLVCVCINCIVSKYIKISNSLYYQPR